MPLPKMYLRMAKRWWLLVVVLSTFAGAADMAACAEGAATPRNIIILFADGVAATQWELGRYSARVLRNQSFAATDVVFRDGAFGLLSTDSRNALVTDSAAAASAMSTGVKVDNFAVSMTPDGKAPRTAMEAAKSAGRKIGLVTTAEIYDASPAAFSVHAKNRSDAQSIVDQYLAMELDVLVGGGRDYFLPKSAPGGKRSDGKDMIAAFEQKGYRIARDTRELKNADGAKLLGLFADEDMSFEIDRDPAKEPSMAEMARAALKALSSASPNGFVLFVENENTDTAGHLNDAAGVMRALWAFDEALKVALDFRSKAPNDTLVIVTGDHETGG
ncbi:MAG TPA: alkaline phosphatase, partial [Casimicrobiaceae bacterium]